MAQPNIDGLFLTETAQDKDFTAFLDTVHSSVSPDFQVVNEDDKAAKSWASEEEDKASDPAPPTADEAAIQKKI